MARHGLSRPEGTAPFRGPIVPHDRWDRTLNTGSLDLVLTTLPGRFVSPGTGRLAVLGPQGSEVVAHRAARSVDRPVLPGSGIKGAVRTLYELLSASCNPFDTGRDGCGSSQACDACSLFGARGLTGRVSFGDATPWGEPIQRETRSLPVGHDPKAEETRGDFRLYDLRAGGAIPAARKGSGSDEKAAREVYLGSFRTRLSFTNTSEGELGRLLLCCGLAGGDARGFPLRLGGVKYEGQGAVSVEIDALSHRWPRRERLDKVAAQERAARWIVGALGADWGHRFGATYHKLSETLRLGEGRP